MRIECPGCAAAYEVPAAQLGPGRVVRCARCDRQWAPSGLAEPPAIAAVRAASTLLRASAIRVPAVPCEISAGPVPPHWARPTWGIGWAASVLLLVGLAAGSAHWSRAIMQGWPPSIRLYAALGAAGQSR